MDTKYTNIMEQGINDKSILKQFLNYNMDIIDVGCSTGALTFEMGMEAYSKCVVRAVEPDKETFEVLKTNVETFSNVIPMNNRFDELHYNEPHNIVLSSVFHHMLTFRNEATWNNIRKWFKDWKKGTRVLIRDGVRPSPRRANEVIGVVCTPQSLKLAKRFLKEFYIIRPDLPTIPHIGIGYSIDYHIEGCTVWAERWLITELMLTITWGEDSMKRECQEWYTIMGIEDYLDIFRDIGYKVLYAESIIQPGYQIFLPKLGKLINKTGYEIPLPFTNLICAFEKE